MGNAARKVAPKKSTPEKFDLVRTDSAEVAAKYLRIIPSSERGDESPVRWFRGRGVFCANFKGSELALHKRYYRVKWKTIDGIDVGSVERIT